MMFSHDILAHISHKPPSFNYRFIGCSQHHPVTVLFIIPVPAHGYHICGRLICNIPAVFYLARPKVSFGYISLFIDFTDESIRLAELIELANKYSVIIRLLTVLSVFNIFTGKRLITKFDETIFT